MHKKAIIIGASAGIGKALAIELGKNGYELGLTARRVGLLESLQKEIATRTWVQQMDVADTEAARTQLAALVEKMGGMDILILNAAVGLTGTTWEENKTMIEVNTLGNISLGDFGVHYFKDKKQGHLVGISSVAMHRAFRTSVVYSATKSFLSAYLQGIRHFFAYKKLPVDVTDIRPGFVETDMTSVNDPKKMFWISKPETAAYYIRKAIENKKSIAYITPRWWLIGQIMRLLPDWLVHKT